MAESTDSGIGHGFKNSISAFVTADSIYVYSARKALTVNYFAPISVKSSEYTVKVRELAS